MRQMIWLKLCLVGVLIAALGCQSASDVDTKEAVQWVPVSEQVYAESTNVIHQPGYCDRFARNMKVLDRYARFEKIGVKVYHLTLRGENTEFYTTPYWTDLDTYPADPKYQDPSPASLEVQAESILKTVPDARFVIHFFAAPPKAWATRFPDQIQTGSDGKVYRAASYASESWLVGQEKMIANMVTHLQGLSWGKQVDGYVIIPHTEGGTELSVYGEPFDQAGAMQQAYTQFLSKKYTTNQSLQQAWDDQNVTLQNVKVPTLSQYNTDRASWMTWPVSSQTQRYRDYFLLQHDLLKDAFDRMAKAVHNASERKIFAALDALKQPMSGWLISDAFEAKGLGLSFPHLLLSAGSFNVADILDLPSIDGFMTPADYTARSVGWGFELEGIADSVVLRKKIMYAEDDARSWVKSYSRKTQGAWRNAKEAHAGLLRNLAMCASRGVSHYWANASDGYFDDDQNMQVLADLLPQARAALSTPVAPTEHAIAMILDDESGLYTDFTSGFSQLAVMQQRVHDLPLTGLPYRIHLLSDLKRDDFPKFRAYLFPDLFKLTPEKMALIRAKVLSKGSIAIFGPGTGVASVKELTDKTIAAQEVSEFLGINLELVPKTSARRVLVNAGTHPALSDIAGPVVYGDSYAYGPILTPPVDVQEGIVELGRGSIYWSLNTAGLVMREFGNGAGSSATRGEGDYAVVFSAAMPIPASVLRSLALYAGCNAWSDLGDVVHASGRMVSVHSARPGARTLQLPEPAFVTDLERGEKTTLPVREINLELQGPGTRMYLLEPVSGK